MKLGSGYTWRKAFTLVEMAVVLIIVGLMTGLILHTQEVAHPSNCYAVTQSQMVTINSALSNYVHVNNRYPVPAGRSLGVNDTSFGREAVLPGQASNIDSIANGGNPVLIGALPFQTLGLTDNFAADCWGNKFTYAVTKSMTSSNPSTGFPSPSATGVLHILSGSWTSTVVTYTSAAWVVISHGETGGNTGNGGVQKNYSTTGSHNWCATPTSGTSPIDHENCDISNANFYVTTFNNGANAGANFYDDIVIYGGKQNSNCNASSYTASWTDGTGTIHCSATVAGPINNLQTQVGVASTASGSSGSADVTCTNGVITTSNATCSTSACSSSTVSWTDSSTGLTCSGTASGSSGVDVDVTTTTSGDTGNAHYMCIGGTWTPLGGTPTCVATPVGCSATTMSWTDYSSGSAVTCTGNFPPTAVGSSAGPEATTTAGYTGAGYANCTTNGPWTGWSSAHGTCTTSAVCNSALLSWTDSSSGKTCSATFASQPAGYSPWMPNTDAPGGPPDFVTLNGIGQAQCVNSSGTMTWTGMTGHCLQAGSSDGGGCPTATLSWTDTSTGATCSGNFAGEPGIGVIVGPVTTTTSGHSGSGSALCGNSGGGGSMSSWVMAFGTCTDLGSGSCTAQSGSWTDPATSNTCSSPSFPITASGSTSTQSAVNAGFTGSGTGTCTSGTWSFSGTCDVSAFVNGSCGATRNACTAGVSANSVQHSGYATWDCQGTGGGTTASCTVPYCSPVEPVWGSDTCFTISGMDSAPVGVTRYQNNTVMYRTGSASATCTLDSGGTTASFVTNSAFSCEYCPSGYSCAPLGCPATTMNWGAGTGYSWSGGCSANLSAASDGATSSATNTAAGYSGSATYHCSIGIWVDAGGSSCTQTTVDGSCAGTFNTCATGTPTGANATVGSWSCAGSGGGATASCEICPSFSGSWGSGCSATFPASTPPAGGYSFSYGTSTGTHTGSAHKKCTPTGWTGSVISDGCT